MLKRLRTALTPSMAISILALFVALGGAGIAATGGNFILGQPNTANTPTELTATGTAATALDLTVPAGKPALKVSNQTKIAKLNADALDGLDGSAFLRRGAAVSQNVTNANGVVDVTNTGTGNGVQGKTNDFAASGVYGEHNRPGGFGVAGRAGDGGHAIYGDNTGDGYAGYFEDKVHVGGGLTVAGPLSDGGSFDCNGCVAAEDVVGKVSSADRLDGLDSTAFMQAAGGVADGQSIDTAPNTTVYLGPPIGGLVRLRYQCPFNVGGNGILRILNATTSPANLFVDSGGANPDYLQLGSTGFAEYPAAAGGESFSIQMQGVPGVALVTVATAHRGSTNDCHAQAFGMLAG